MLRALPIVVEPDTWTLAFHRTSPKWWVRLLAWGKYQHVSAFAWVAPLKTWVVFDVTLSGTKLYLLPDSHAALNWISAYTHDADLMQIPPFRRSRKLGGIIGGIIVKLAPLYCVPAIKSLIGLRCGALRPDALWRHLVAAGGTVVDARVESTTTADKPGNLGLAGGSAG